jgi:hypothetical protein
MGAILKSQKFWEPYLSQFVEGMAVINHHSPDNYLEQSKKAIVYCKDLLHQLQREVEQHGFADQDDEIHFFKNIKPALYSQLIYYHKVYNVEIACPVGLPNDIKSYFEKEIEQINSFFEEHKFFYSYARHSETLLDDKLFLRNNDSAFLPLKIYDIHASPDFSTRYDYIFSRMKANEMLLNFLQKKLNQINRQASQDVGLATKPAAKALIWTDSKVALIELIYALKAKGSLNNGKATIKEISDLLQEIFQVELTNPSRDFQEILRRKTGYSNYLDNLRDSYLKHIDVIESKAR